MVKTNKKLKRKYLMFLVPTFILGVITPFLFVQNKKVINQSINTFKANEFCKNINEESTKDIELNTNEYMVNGNLLEGTQIGNSYKFGLSNISSINSSNNNNWWSMRLNDGNPQILSFAKKFNFVANSFDPEKLSVDKIDNTNDTSNLLNFIMYDSAGAQIESDVLKNVKDSYKLNDSVNKYGFDIDNISTNTTLFDNKKLSEDNPLMLVTSKFYYGDDQDYKPIPVIINDVLQVTQVEETNFSKLGIYDRADKKSWFSSGYFGYDRNAIYYYAPTKEQSSDDFKLDETKLSTIKDAEKKLTAQDFFDSNRKRFSSFLQLNINNALPGTFNGKMIASIDNAKGEITFRFKPSFLYKIEYDNNHNPIQKGLVQNNDIEYTIGSISGFYTNTSRIQASKDFLSGDLGEANIPSEVQENDVKKYIYDYKDKFWTQLAPANSQDEQDIINFFQIIGGLQPDNSNNKLTFTIRPAFKLVNGGKVANDDNTLDVTISLTDFVKKEDTSFVVLPTPKKEIYPSKLQEYFNSSLDNKEQLKTKLKEFVDIKGSLYDIPNVQIDKIEVTNHSNTLGTATIIIWASNFRQNDTIVTASTAFPACDLTNLLTINPTTIKNEIDYIPNIQGPYTVEKFIYDLSTNPALSDQFLKDLESEQYQVVVNKPKDAILTLEKGTDVWYSNRNKTLNLIVKLTEYANEQSDIIPGKQDGWPLTIKLPNAIVPEGPTKLEGQINFDNASNYFVTDVDDNMLKAAIWKNLTPKINSDEDLKNISKFPTNLDGSIISAEKNIDIQIVKKDIPNGTISFKYGLNLYYDEKNLNTTSNTIWSDANLTSFKKPDITKYDANNKTIDISNGVPSLNNLYANDFKDLNDLNNQDLINKITTHIQLSGNTANTSITYNFLDSNTNDDYDDYYKGQLKINVSINNAWVYDENAIDNGFIKNENIDLGEFTIVGFKKYLNTSFNQALEKEETDEYKINIKTLKPDNDTTANKIDWSSDNLQELIFENRKTIFQDLPIDIKKEDIIITEPQYQVDGANLDNPYILLNIKLKKAVSNTAPVIGEKPLGNLKIYGFRKSQETIITPNTNPIQIGNPEILAQAITNNNFTNNVNIQKLSDFGQIENEPKNWNPKDSIQVEINSYNNKTGTIVANLIFKNIYIKDQDGRFPPLGDSQSFEFTISGFKPVVSTAFKATIDNSPIKINISDFSQTLASEVNLDVLKTKILENINQILADNSYYQLAVDNLTFTSNDYTAINYDKNEDGQGSITFNNTFKINSYIDDKYKWITGTDLSIPGTLIITGFKGNKPTEINEDVISNGIIIPQLENIVAQTMSDSESFNKIKDNIINQIFVDYFQSPVQKPGLLDNPSNRLIEQKDLDVQLVDNSWNNKDGSIRIKLILKKIINTNGFDVNNNTTPFTKEITIKGFKQVEETAIVSTLDSNQMGDTFKTKYDTYPQSIVEDKNLFSTLKNDIETWLNKDKNIFKILENKDGKDQNELFIDDNSANIPNDLYTIYESPSGFSNKNGTVSFRITINQKYTYAGDSLFYNSLLVTQTIALKIGTAIPNETIIKNKINIKDNEQLSKLWPNQIEDIKSLIIEILENQRKKDPKSFIQNNLLFQNLPQEWADENFNLADHIDIKKIESSDDSGIMSISISIKDAPIFVRDDNDNKFEKLYSSTDNQQHKIVLTGFPSKGTFPIIPVALGSAALLVVIIILILAIYYLHKRRKYKTVTVANESEMK